MELAGECLKCLFRLTRGVSHPRDVIGSTMGVYSRVQVRIPSRGMDTFLPHTVSSIFRLSLTHTHTHAHARAHLHRGTHVHTHTHTHTHTHAYSLVRRSPFTDLLGVARHKLLLVNFQGLVLRTSDDWLEKLRRRVHVMFSQNQQPALTTK